MRASVALVEVEVLRTGYRDVLIVHRSVLRRARSAETATAIAATHRRLPYLQSAIQCNAFRPNSDMGVNYATIAIRLGIVVTKNPTHFPVPYPPQRQPSLKGPLPHLYLLSKLLLYTSKYPTPRSSLAKKVPYPGRYLEQHGARVLYASANLTKVFYKLFAL